VGENKPKIGQGAAGNVKQLGVGGSGMRLAVARGRAFWGLAWCFALAFGLSAGAQRFTYRQYDLSDGLTDMTIQNLLQDHAGYIWAGTDNGLFRYDGSRFVGFHNEDGLPDTTIRGIAESPDGVLWVATHGGIARFNGKRFEKVDVGESGVFRRVAFDSLGQMYLESPTGLVRGTPDGQGGYRFALIQRGAVVGLGIHGREVLFCRDGELWRVTGETAERIGSPNGLPAGRYSSVVEDSLGNLWALSATSLFERAAGQTRFVDRTAGLPRVSLLGLYADTHGRLFVSSDAGVTVLDGDERLPIDAAHGLPADGVKPVLLDREGSLWLGAQGSGLLRQLGRGQWVSWKKEDGLPSNSVWAIHRDPSGRVWVGSNGGLTEFDASGEVLRNWNRRDGLTGDEIYAIAESPKGEIYASAYPNGITRVSASGKLQALRSPSVQSAGWILAMAIDSEGRLWTAGSAGCFRSRKPVDEGEPEFDRIQIAGQGQGGNAFDVRADGETVWVANSKGLARYAHGQWSVFTQRDGLRSDRVGLIAPGPRGGGGELWIAYDNALGLTRLRFAGGRLEAVNFTRMDGLASDKIYALAFDSAGRLWATTDAGVDVLETGELAGKDAVLDRASLRFRHYGTADGLIWNDANSYALETGPGGAVWVGTSGGLSRYTPSRFPQADTPPPIVLTEIDSPSGLWQPGDRPRLPFAQRSLFLRYSALSYAAESSLRFRYRLRGYQANWTETRERSVRYEGLPYGDYLFEVTAAGPDGVWSPVPAEFFFSIAPAWWQSWWFVSACVAAGILLVAGVIRLRVRVLVLQQRRLERLVADRTAELTASHARLEEIAYCDTLTMLPNRRKFTQQLRARLELGQATQERFGLLLIDLDRFKQINDTFGHDAGDAVLVAIANRLSSVVRASDCVARLGGDEFAILLLGDCESVALEQVCERIVSCGAEAIPYGGSSLLVSASVGVAIFPDDGTTETSLYKAADVALYESKRTGSSFSCRKLTKPLRAMANVFPARHGLEGSGTEG